MKRYLLALLLFIFACGGIKFEKDLGFVPSAVANSPEVYVLINGAPCKDADGLVGFCAKRLKTDQTFSMKVPAHPYDYLASFDCTDSVQSQPEQLTVLAGLEHTFEIPATNYGDARVFNCSLTIRPLDRPEPIASFVRVSVVLLSADYTRLESPTLQQGALVGGKYSYSIAWEDQSGKWRYAKTSPVLKAPGLKRAIVESYSARLAYYGF